MKAAADLTLKAGAIALVMMLGCVVGRICFLVLSGSTLRYLPSAAGIEFLWVAPFGAVPGSLMALVFMTRERRTAIKQIRKLSENPLLTTDQQVAIIQTLELLKERKP